jgi:hypothetical protein
MSRGLCPNVSSLAWLPGPSPACVARARNRRALREPPALSAIIADSRVRSAWSAPGTVSTASSCSPLLIADQRLSSMDSKMSICRAVAVSGLNPSKS